MLKVLVLFTCFNRKEKTLACISSLRQDTKVKFSFIIVDDNSSDGTLEMLNDIEDVIVINGTGNLYYSGGMRRAIYEAKQKDLSEYEYIMLINDDVVFFKDSVSKLINYLGKEKEILVGATCDDNNKLSYSGSLRTSNLRPSYKNVMSSSKKVYCDTFCANCVLIPKDIFVALDNIDPVYRHAMGDYDYGWAARKAGYHILASNFYVGLCNDNPITNTWKDTSLSRICRLNKKESFKGLPFREYFYYLNKNHGLLTAFVYSIIPYIRILINK